MFSGGFWSSGMWIMPVMCLVMPVVMLIVAFIVSKMFGRGGVRHSGHALGHHHGESGEPETALGMFKKRHARWKRPRVDASCEFRSNGEQIFFTATSQRGGSITADVGMEMMGGGTPTCAGCHGSDGRGGKGRMMLRSFEASDIRYSTLTAETMGHEHKEEEHPPHTDETIKRAIALGVNPAGESLEWPMPRWTMSDRDLNGLLDYLKSLP